MEPQFDTAQFAVPSLFGGQDAVQQALLEDLANVLVAHSGVHSIAADRHSRKLDVTYDADHIDRDTIQELIEGTGYPIE